MYYLKILPHNVTKHNQNQFMGFYDIVIVPIVYQWVIDNGVVPVYGT